MNPLNPQTKSEAALDQLLALTFGAAGDDSGLDPVHKERFEVLGTLGVGGMGSVFRARDRTLDRQVALKLVRPELLRNDEARSRFLREGRILSQFNHPNLCQLYDYVQGPTSDVLVMELVEGQTLAALVEAGATQTVPRAERLDWMLALTQALVVAHGAGIIHRDLKPANVMVAQDGVVKVLDFGIARDGSSTTDERPFFSDLTSAVKGGEGQAVRTSESVLRTQAGRVMGTPQYMSPEQKRGDVVGAASDLYALGLIFDNTLKPRASGWRDRELRKLITGLTAPRAIERPTAQEVEQRLRRWIALPRRRAIQALTLGTLLAFGLLVYRYVRDLGHERDLVLARQAQSERVIAFLVDDVAERLEEVGTPELLAELDRQSIDYFHAVDAAELTDPEMRRWVEAMLGVGQRIRTHDRLKAAREVYLAAEAFLERRLQEEPMSMEWRFEAGQVNFYLGEIARDLHDQASALHAWTRYRDLSAELLESDPHNATFQDELAYAKTNLGVLAFERDELNLAEMYFREALKHWQGRVQAQPKQSDWIVEQADSLSWVSETLRSQGQFSAALLIDREVRDLQQGLYESDRGNRLYEHRYVLSLYQVARSLGFTGQHPAAASAAEAAHAGALQLSAYDPNQGDWARTCALTASLFALNLLTLGRAEEAEPIVDVARRQLDEMRQRDPSNQDWQSLSVLLYGIASETSLARGDLIQAQDRLASVDQELVSLGLRLDRADLVYLEILRLTADSLQAQATNKPAEDPLAHGSEDRLKRYLQDRQPIERWKLERAVMTALIDSGHVELARDWRETQLFYFQPSSFLNERLNKGLNSQSSGTSNE